LSRFEVVFLEKFALFIASMGKFFVSDRQKNRPLWERAFLGALCACNGLVCSLQSHLCSFFSFYKDKKNKSKSKKKTRKNNNNKLHLTPSPWGVQSCFFCFCFFGFLVFCFLGSLLF